MEKHHLYDGYTLVVFTPKEVKQILSVPYKTFGAYLSLLEWHEIVMDLSIIVRNKHTIHLLEMMSSSLLDHYKVKFAEQYIQIQMNIGEYPYKKGRD